MPRGYYSGQPDISDLQQLGGPAYNPLSPSPNIGGALRHAFSMFMGFTQQRQERERQQQEDLSKQQLQQAQAEYYQAQAKRAMMPIQPKPSELTIYQGKKDIDIAAQPEIDKQKLDIFKKQEEIKANLRAKPDTSSKEQVIKSAKINRQLNVVNRGVAMYQQRIATYEKQLGDAGEIEKEAIGKKINNLKIAQEKLATLSMPLASDEPLADRDFNILNSLIGGIGHAESDPYFWIPEFERKRQSLARETEQVTNTTTSEPRIAPAPTKTASPKTKLDYNEFYTEFKSKSPHASDELIKQAWVRFLGKNR